MGVQGAACGWLEDDSVAQDRCISRALEWKRGSLAGQRGEMRGITVALHDGVAQCFFNLA